LEFTLHFAIVMPEIKLGNPPYGCVVEHEGRSAK
jgi:hypothetical protein